MKKVMGFKKSFEQRLDKFVKMRNSFVHDYWVKNNVHALDELIDPMTYKAVATYEAELYSETLYMMQVFIGLHYAIGAEIASKEDKYVEFESDLKYEDMKQYLPNFLSVVNGRVDY